MEPALGLLDSRSLWHAIESAAEQAELAIFVTRLGNHPEILYVSPRAAAIVGRSRDELVGQPPWSMLVDGDRDAVRAVVDRSPDAAPPVALHLTIARPDGARVPIELASTRIVAPDGAMMSFGYFRDVTAEHTTLAALKQSEARFRFLVEAAPDGVVILQRGIVVFMNPKAARLLGCERTEDAIGKPIASFLPPEDARLTHERIREMIRTGVEREPSEYRVLADPDRVVEIKSILCEWNDAQAVLAFARDVTERKAIQQRLVAADRLAALGTLAAGVAHEINNPLTYAQLSAQRIERILGTLPAPAAQLAQLRELVNDIEHGISRVATITQSLRAFARPDDTTPGVVDLDVVLAHAIRMVDNDLRHVANLVHDRAEIPAVTGNASRLEQVFVNLLLNAIQALPSADTPRQIRITVAHAGEHVTVAIADDGRGIPAAIRGKIFDPFFTTRAVGEGMGLGLAVSKSIVESFGGRIDVDSTEGVGTTMTVTLRVHGAPAPPAEEVVDVPAPIRRRILVVDDEELVRSTIGRLIERDHDVTFAATGPEALDAVARAPFDVILCDVMMPGMNGLEVYRRIADRHAEIRDRVVFMTAGAFGAGAADLQGLSNVRLPKPFRIEQLLAVIQQVAG